MTINFLHNLHLEHRAAAVLGIAGLLVSITVGFVAGIGADTVLLRAFLFSIFFAGIGFGSIFVLKKYVPELYDTLAGIGSSAAVSTAVPEGGVNQDAAPGSDDAGEVADGESSGMGTPRSAEGGDFAELSADGLARYTTAGTAASDRKLGKHILEKDKMVNYEPKIMAQAIRTMMLKDTD